MARRITNDPVLEELERLIRDEGMTPWVASKEVVRRGLTRRCQSTLFYHARKVGARIIAEMALDFEDMVRCVEAGGDVLVPVALATSFAAGLEDAGITYVKQAHQAVQFRGAQHCGRATT